MPKTVNATPKRKFKAINSIFFTGLAKSQEKLDTEKRILDAVS
jgi:hypothetical protein